jgi:hypothetical protein
MTSVSTGRECRVNHIQFNVTYSDSFDGFVTWIVDGVTIHTDYCRSPREAHNLAHYHAKEATRRGYSSTVFDFWVGTYYSPVVTDRYPAQDRTMS